VWFAGQACCGEKVYGLGDDLISGEPARERPRAAVGQTQLEFAKRHLYCGPVLSRLYEALRRWTMFALALSEIQYPFLNRLHPTADTLQSVLQPALLLA
jgi:hypothetical protein